MSGKAPKQKETAQQKALAEVGAKYWQDYMERGKAVESKYREKLNRLGSDDAVARTTQQGMAGLEAGVGFGLNPLNPGQAIGKGIAKGSARAGIAGDTPGGMQQQYQQGQQEIVAMGRGVRGQGDEMLTRSAARSQVGEQARLYSDQIKQQGLSDMVGTGVGYGLYKWGTTNKPLEAVDESLNNAMGVSPAATTNLLNIRRQL